MNEHGLDTHHSNIMEYFCHSDDDDDKTQKDKDAASSLREEKCGVPSSSSTAADETRGDDAQQQDHAEAAAIHPFEWLTSLESLDDVLRFALETSRTTSSTANTDSILPSACRVLDIGCGSSMLGEYLLQHSTLRRFVSQVVNVDKDPATLQAMQERWKQKTKKSLSLKKSGHDDMEDRLLFLPPIDFVEQSIECPPPPPAASSFCASAGDSGLFHVIVDKSTLDCALCTDHAAAALLCQVYRLLRRDNGVYIVVSFHHVDFLRPLLQDLPGTDWELSFHVIHRQVEEADADKSNILPPPPQGSDACLLHGNGTDASSSSSAWSSGCFNPNDSYRRTVNAVLCRRRGSKEKPSETETTASTTCNNSNLDRNAAYKHIND
jgi:SAM-dependent methyltransferase